MNTQYERILVPTDGSPEAETAVAHAVELASRYGATLHALSVVDVSHFKGLDVDTSVIAEGFEAEARAAVERVAEAGEKAAVPVEQAVLDGTPTEVILDYVDEHDVDLIVAGTRSHQGLERFLIGSVTDRLVRHADVPVLTVRTTA